MSDLPSGCPLSTAQWVASGYLLALAAVVPVTGWLTRRIGARPVWLAALASFTLISGGCALAGNMSELADSCGRRQPCRAPRTI